MTLDSVNIDLYLCTYFLGVARRRPWAQAPGLWAQGLMGARPWASPRAERHTVEVALGPRRVCPEPMMMFLILPQCGIVILGVCLCVGGMGRGVVDTPGFRLAEYRPPTARTHSLPLCKIRERPCGKAAAACCQATEACCQATESCCQSRLAASQDWLPIRTGC